MKRVYIYSLIDENGYFRYIGISKNPKARFACHISESIKSAKTHKNKWIRSMFNKGLKPELYLIDVFNTPEEAKKEEIRLIEYFNNHVKLTNGTKGGDGQYGVKMSEEQKQKISISKKLKNWKPSKEHLEKIKSSTSLSVLQYDLEGNFIREYKSAREASRNLNTNCGNISRACRNISSEGNNTKITLKGFIFKYKKEVTNVL